MAVWKQLHQEIWSGINNDFPPPENTHTHTRTHASTHARTHAHTHTLSQSFIFKGTEMFSLLFDTELNYSVVFLPTAQRLPFSLIYYRVRIHLELGIDQLKTFFFLIVRPTNCYIFLCCSSTVDVCMRACVRACVRVCVCVCVVSLLLVKKLAYCNVAFWLVNTVGRYIC